MEQVAGEIAGGDVQILFQPHVGPFDRGILSTVYCQPKTKLGDEQLSKLYRDFYTAEPFVEIIESPPAVKDVAGTNYCHIYPCLVKGRIVVFSAIDNLVKGASGQAVGLALDSKALGAVAARDGCGWFCDDGQIGAGRGGDILADRAGGV